MESRLYKKYKDEVKPFLQTERAKANVPDSRSGQIVHGVDATLENYVDDAVKDMTTITGCL